MLNVSDSLRQYYNANRATIIALFITTFAASMLLIAAQYYHLFPTDKGYYVASASNWIIRAAIALFICSGINRKFGIALLIYVASNVIDEAYFNYRYFELNDMVGVSLAALSFLLPTIGEKRKLDVLSLGFVLAALVLFFSRNDFYGLSNPQYDYLYNKGDGIAILITSITMMILSRKGVLSYVAGAYMCFALFNMLNEVVSNPNKLERHEIVIFGYFTVIAAIAIIWKSRKDKGLSVKAINVVNYSLHLSIAIVLLIGLMWQLFSGV